MIETYKIITGKYQGCVAHSLVIEEIYVTRGNDLKLQKLRVRYDLRKFGFSNRVVNKWNSLPNWVVPAITTNTFKARLDKFWRNQDRARPAMAGGEGRYDINHLLPHRRRPSGLDWRQRGDWQ